MPARIPMTERQRAALLALPDSEAAVVRHHGLDAEDLAAIGTARTPATRLSYALQLCCLRYPGRHLRAGELLPAIMLEHIAEQVGVDAGAISDFARRAPTRYDQLAAIKARFGFTDLSRPARGIMMTWLETEAMAIVDGRILLDRLLDELRTRRIVIPGISVVERMAAEAMLRAETDLVAAVDDKLDADMRQRLDTLVDEKVHHRQSRLSWLREPEPRVASASLAEILEKVALIHRTGIACVPVDPLHEPRLTQFAREGVRYTAQAFQQMRASRRRVILLATLRELEATLTDAAIAMFGSLMGRAHLRARKRLEQGIAISGREGRDRLMRIATVLETVSRAARAGEDIGAALRDIVPLDMLDADAAIIRRTAAPHRDDVLSEIAAEYRTFKRAGPLFLQTLDFHGRAGTAALRNAMTVLSDLDGNWRKPLPADVPLGHVERRWHRHVMVAGKIDRTHWEMATYGALAKMAVKSTSARSAIAAQEVAAELVVVRAAGEAPLPRRQGGRATDRVAQLTALLVLLVGKDGAIDRLAFRKSLEARAPMSVKALANDLACYAAFCARAGGIGLPANEARIVAYLEDCERRELKPATVGRRLASLAVVHGLLGVASPTQGSIVRDALRGFRRRVDVTQRQAGPLRFGEGLGSAPAKGFTLSALLQACPGTLPGLRDGALLSLAYDTGLRVSELVRVACDHITVERDGSAVLTVPRSKTDQEGQGAYAWLSPDTMRRVSAWLTSGGIAEGPLFRRIGVVRTKARAAEAPAALPAPPGFRWRLPDAAISPDEAQPKLASTTFVIGKDPLTPAAVRLIIKRTARSAADEHLVNLFGNELDNAIAVLSTHSLRVGLTQDLFASGEDAGPIAQALRWTSTSTALRYGRKLAPSSNATARMLREVRG